MAGWISGFKCTCAPIRILVGEVIDVERVLCSQNCSSKLCECQSGCGIL